MQLSFYSLCSCINHCTFFKLFMRSKPVFLLLLFFFFHHFTLGQNKHIVDSLLTVLKTVKEDTVKVKALNRLSYEFISSNPDSTVLLTNSARLLAAKLNYNTGIAASYFYSAEALITLNKNTEAVKASEQALHFFELAFQGANETQKKIITDFQYRVYTSMGNAYYITGNFAMAINCFKESLLLAKQMNKKSSLAISYGNIGIMESEQGNYPEGLKNQLLSLAIIESLPDKPNVDATYNNIGNIYDAMDNFQEALNYHLKALKLREENGDKDGIADSHSNMGNAYAGLGNYNEALKNDYIALKLWTELGDEVGMATSYVNLGLRFASQKKYDEALKNYFECIKHAEPIGETSNHANACTEIGIIYTYQKKYKEAQMYLDKALALAKEMESLEHIYTTYQAMSSLDSAMGNYKDALMHYKLTMAYHDSLFNQENAKKAVQLQMQYDFNKKEADAKAEQEKKDAVAAIDAKRQRIIRNSTFAGLGFVMLFSLVVYRQRNKIYREKKRSDQLVVDKEMLIKEIHHRVKNNLEVISSLLELQSAGMDDGKAKAAVAEGQSRVQSIALIHHKLYRNDDVTSVEFKGFVSDLYKQVESVFKKPGTEVEFKLDAAETKINIDAAVPLGLILNELLTNTFKYGVDGNKKNVISIELSPRDNADNYVLVFKDNGPGIPVGYNLENSTSLGMRVIQLLTKQLGGQLKFYNDNGSVFEIPFFAGSNKG